MTVNDRVWNMLEVNFGSNHAEYSNADRAYRDALESMSLAMEQAGIHIDIIMECIVTACDAYGNNAVE